MQGKLDHSKRPDGEVSVFSFPCKFISVGSYLFYESLPWDNNETDSHDQSPFRSQMKIC